MDGTLENSKTKNVSTCSIGSVTTTDNNSSVSWEGTGPLEASGAIGALEALEATGVLEASGAPGARYWAMGKIGLRGYLFHHLYKAPPRTRTTPTSIVEAAVI